MGRTRRKRKLVRREVDSATFFSPNKEKVQWEVMGKRGMGYGTFSLKAVQRRHGYPTEDFGFFFFNSYKTIIFTLKNSIDGGWSWGQN